MSTGRVIIPAYYSITPNDDGDFSTAYVMYSDDQGASWHIGGNWSYGLAFPNENQCAELPNAVLYCHARGLETFRIQAWSKDGGETFGQVTEVHDLVQPLTGCEGSTIRYPPKLSAVTFALCPAAP